MPKWTHPPRGRPQRLLRTRPDEGKTAEVEPGAAVDPPLQKTEPQAGKTPKLDTEKKLDLLNMLKQLKRPGSSAGGSGGIEIEDDESDEASGDEA